MDALRTELEELRHAKEEAETSHTEARKDLEDENAALKDASASKNSEAETMQKALDDRNARLEELGNNLDSEKEAKEALSSEVSALTQQLEGLQATLDSTLVEKNSALEAQTSRIEELIEELQEASKSKADVGKLEEAIAAKESDLADARQALAEKDTEISKMIAKVEGVTLTTEEFMLVEAQNMDLKLQVERLKDELDLVSCARRELQADIERLQGLEDEKTRLMADAAKCKEAEAALEEARRVVTELQAKTEKDSLEVSCLKTENSTLASELSALQPEVETLRNSNDAMAADLSASKECLKDLEARLHAAALEMEEKEISLRQMQDEIFKAETELSTNSNELRAQREACTAQERKVAELEASLAGLETEAAELKAANTRYQEEQENYKRQLEISSKSLTREGELQIKLQEVEAEAVQLKAELSLLYLAKQELTDVNEKNELLEARVKELSKMEQSASEKEHALQLSKEENMLLENRVKGLLEEIEEAKARENALKGSLEDTHHGHEEALWEMQARLDEAVKKIATLKQELQSEREGATSVQTSHKTAIAAMEAQLEQSAMQGSSMLSTIEEIRETSKQQKQESEKQLQQLMSTNNMLQAKLCASTTRCEDLNDALLKEQLEVSTLKSRLAEAHCTDTVERLQRELKEQSEELERLRAHLHHVQATNKGFDDECAKLKSMEDDLMRQKWEIEQELRDKNNALQEKERYLNKMHEDLVEMRTTAETKYDAAVAREKLLSSRLHVVEAELKKKSQAPLETDRLSQIEDLLCQAFNEVRQVEDTLHSRVAEHHSAHGGLNPAMPPHRYREAIEAFSPPRLSGRSHRSVSPPMSKASGRPMPYSMKNDESVGRRIAAIENRLLSTRAPAHGTPSVAGSKTSRASTSTLNPSFRAPTKRAISIAFNGSVIP
eukprot:TRINITY_DN1022_c0_g1_i1.p1 TRINITY_DN1022_c0_g1~~TRINITY_DN1022_c0_g1_i1.p1  ORF type:complete len:907 (+),score=306.37 TRINITY_DN1022_c0_g1_i1:1391-4111(+)